jgi:hypothetical protein
VAGSDRCGIAAGGSAWPDDAVITSDRTPIEQVADAVGRRLVIHPV